MIAALFPGQGSQKPGMGRDLYDNVSVSRRVFDQVSQATGLDLAHICFELDDDSLRETQRAQMALYTCGVAAHAALVESGIAPTVMAGHSVGEYAALAAAGIVSVEDGARLVQRRGDLMARSGQLRPGTMSAILGMDRAALDGVCRGASTADEVVVVANDNCPGQLVISGDRPAVERANALALGAGAKRAMPLNVSGAFHSPLMEEAATAMGEALRLATFTDQPIVVYANVTAAPQPDPSAWPGLLEAQLKSTVRWTETVQAMIADGVDTFLECGGGEVLGGLVRRVSKEVMAAAVYDQASRTRVLQEVQG